MKNRLGKEIITNFTLVYAIFFEKCFFVLGGKMLIYIYIFGKSGEGHQPAFLSN